METSVFPSREPLSVKKSVKSVISGTLGASVVGLVAGTIHGAWTGRIHPGTGGFTTSVRLSLMAVPFFAMRECVLHYRLFINKQRDIPPHLVRDRDELAASAVSGICTGGLLAYVSQGPLAILVGSVTFGFYAGTGQFVFNILRRMRQNAALERFIQQKEIEEGKRSQEKPWFGPEGIWNNRFVENAPEEPPKRLLERVKDIHDPATFITNKVLYFLQEYIFGEFPEWASPLVKAFDDEYRDKIFLRVEILKEQVRVLQEEIDMAKQEIDKRSCSTKH